MANEMVRTTTLVAARKRKKFLLVLAQTCSVAVAARAAGYQDTSTLKRYRRENEAFAEAWEQAVDDGIDVLEEELLRRAVHGVKKPLLYKGEIVAYETVRSDSNLQFALRAANPDKYRENVRGGNMSVNFGIAFLPAAAKDEDDWEEKALEMHKGQTVLLPEVKPTENAMLRTKKTRLEKVERGD